MAPVIELGKPSLIVGPPDTLSPSSEAVVTVTEAGSTDTRLVDFNADAADGRILQGGDDPEFRAWERLSDEVFDDWEHAQNDG